MRVHLDEVASHDLSCSSKAAKNSSVPLIPSKRARLSLKLFASSFHVGRRWPLISKVLSSHSLQSFSMISFPKIAADAWACASGLLTKSCSQPILLAEISKKAGRISNSWRSWRFDIATRWSHSSSLIGKPSLFNGVSRPSTISMLKSYAFL